MAGQSCAKATTEWAAQNQSIHTGWPAPDGAVYWADSKLGAAICDL